MLVNALMEFMFRQMLAQKTIFYMYTVSSLSDYGVIVAVTLKLTKLDARSLWPTNYTKSYTFAS